MVFEIIKIIKKLIMATIIFPELPHIIFYVVNVSPSFMVDQIILKFKFISLIIANYYYNNPSTIYPLEKIYSFTTGNQ